MSGERTTLKAMIAVGLGFWLFGIAMTETWIICVAPVLVAWSVFHLLTDARSVTRE